MQSILDTSVFILEQAAYHTAKPAVLTQQLKNIQLADDKASLVKVFEISVSVINNILAVTRNAFTQVDMFVNTWTTHGKAVTEELKQRSLTPKQVIIS